MTAKQGGIEVDPEGENDDGIAGVAGDPVCPNCHGEVEYRIGASSSCAWRVLLIAIRSGTKSR